MSALLRRLLAFLCLPVDGDETDPPTDEAAAAADEAPPVDDDPTLEELGEAPPVQREAAPAETPSERRERERAERAEAEVLRMRNSQPAQQHQDPDAAFNAQIERERAANASPERLEWLAYLRDQKRETREARQFGQQAMQSANDARDRASFDRYLIDNPRFKRYDEAVEKHLRDAVANGSPPVPRNIILRLVVGDAVLNNKPKTNAKGATVAPTVNRGRPPMARSDVSARTRKTESEARRQRLEGKII